MVADAPRRIHDLLAYGVPFDRDLEGHLAMSREAAHSRAPHRPRPRRHGRAPPSWQALVAAVRKTPSIRLIEGYVGETPADRGQARHRHRRAAADGGLGRCTFPARAVVLATGGIGHLYAVTTNPPKRAATASAWRPAPAR